jgi:hypothetical protein
MNNCSLSHLTFGAEGSGTSEIKQGYKATLIGCNEATVLYSDRIPVADRLEPNQINPIPVI